MKKLIKTFVASAAVLGVFSINEAMAESLLESEYLLVDYELPNNDYTDDIEMQHNTQQTSLSIDVASDNLGELQPLSDEVREEVVDTKFKKKAGYTQFDPENKDTPLYWATLFNSKSIVKFLIWKGADVNARIENDNTCLHIAARFNSKEIGEILISKGADIDARNNEGNTPLHYAARFNSKEIGEILISKGADVNVVNNGGLTPVMVAVKYKRDEILDLLLKYAGHS